MRSGERKGNAEKDSEKKAANVEGSKNQDRRRQSTQRERERNKNALQHNVGILLRKKMQRLKETKAKTSCEL